MTRSRCVFCSHSGEHWHHVTGRPGPNDPYFDPKFVVPLCRRHHAREHVVVCDKGLEWLPPGCNPVVHRLQRVALFAERCGDFHRAFSLESFAARALAQLVREVIEELSIATAERQSA